MHFEFLGDGFAVIDCPGSVGFSADGALALAAADIALVVVDPEPDRAILAEPALRQLEALGIPHAIFVNKIDQRSEEHTSELQSLMRTSYAVFCLKKNIMCTIRNPRDLNIVVTDIQLTLNLMLRIF